MTRNDVDLLRKVTAETVDCFRCPRLVEWRELVAREKRASFRDEEYWGRPISGFGDPEARILVLGLAPAAHGGNRTGRIFTGDRSGDWLFASMHRVGLANQALSVSLDDGLALSDVWVTAAVKCAPPANKPAIEERNMCVSTFLVRELAALANRRVTVCLGKFAYDVLASVEGLRKRPAFGHGVEFEAADGRTVICSFHPSQQNTFTGKLTEPMIDAVFTRASEIARST